jgi:hypothetical protein
MALQQLLLTRLKPTGYLAPILHCLAFSALARLLTAKPTLILPKEYLMARP